jgi:hypothetical protein
MSLCIDDRLVCRFGWDCSLIQTCTLNGHLYRVTYTRCHIYTINSPDDGCPKYVENGNKYTWKRTVGQVGYLQRLYRDARSTEHKILEGFSKTQFVDRCHYKSRLHYRFLLTTPLRYAFRYGIPNCCRHSSWTAWPFELRAIGCPGNSVRNWPSALHDIPEQRRCRK